MSHHWDRAAKNTDTASVTDPASPSSPSVRLTEFTQPTMTKAANTRYTPQFIGTVTLTKGIYRLGVRWWVLLSSVKKAMAAASCKRNFHPAVRPVFSCLRILA